MNLSIWIVLAVILAVLLWFYRKKHSSKPIPETKINSVKSTKYALSDTEKMISKLQVEEPVEKEEKSKQSETDNQNMNPLPDVGSSIHQNPKNPLSDPVIGSFILAKKKKH